MRTRTISRTRRRSRFRSTMICPYFGTTIPTRAHEDGEAVIRTSSSPDFTRFPVRLTDSISGARDKRCARENLRCDVGCAVEFESRRSLSPASSAGADRDLSAGCLLLLLTRQRTSTATEPSGACDPSCGDVRVLHVPSALTYAREIHAS